MKPSIMRQRGLTSHVSSQPKRKVSWGPNPKAWSKSDLETPLLSSPLVILYTCLFVVMCAVSLHFYMYIPHPVTHGDPNDFRAANSRRHMEDLVSLGIRHVGSEANEVQATALLLRKIQQVVTESSNRVKIDVSVQEVSGSYYLDFLGGLTHLYQNISNIVVRLSRQGHPEPEHSFLINAHFDSALGTVAASDDAVSCGTMLEALRCLSSEPDPLLAEHSLVFLFNGAEETILQASHGFITQHPWAKQIRAFLNLDAAGAGGKEIVFQTGPDHPWLARLYADVVPHPHASVIAQEVFQSGIIPSDTDFRIFRDYGHIPGIDTAYFINGYVYHTEYDIPSAVPDGSIQRAGENVLALLRAVSNSPQLAHPDEQDRHGKVVFFDIMGLMTVVYSEAVAIAMNYSIAIIVFVTVYFGVRSSQDTENTDKPTFVFVLKTMVMLKLSWLAAVVMVTGVAASLSYLGRSMSWFANPLFLLPLYGVPSFLTTAELNVQWMKWNRSMSRTAMERSYFLASQLIWTLYLVILTYCGLCSAFIFLVLTSSPLLFRSLLFDSLIQPELKKGRDVYLYGMAYMLCSLFATGLPVMLRIQLDVGLMEVFVPLTGRMGSVVPPDIVMGALVSLLLSTHTGHVLGVLVYASSAQLKRWSGVILLVVFTTALFLAGSGYMRPYSVQNLDFPKPKRFFITHTDRTFYNQDLSTNRSDSLVFIYPFDYLDLQPIAEETPLYKTAISLPCEGLYCSEPSYIPFKHLMSRNAWSLPGPPLPHLDAPSLTLSSAVRTSDTSTNFTFQAKLYKRGSLFIAPTEGNRMKAWSLETFVPPPTLCPGKYEKSGCYFVFLARGKGEGKFTFWIETEFMGGVESSETLEIAYASQHLDPPDSVTDRLQELVVDLPDWVTAISWTSRYVSWIF